jgi:hypothetical protein
MEKNPVKRRSQRNIYANKEIIDREEEEFAKKGLLNLCKQLWSSGKI